MTKSEQFWANYTPKNGLVCNPAEVLQAYLEQGINEFAELIKEKGRAYFDTDDNKPKLSRPSIEQLKEEFINQNTK